MTGPLAFLSGLSQGFGTDFAANREKQRARDEADKQRAEDRAWRELTLAQQTGITRVRPSTPLEAGGSAVPDLPTVLPPQPPAPNTPPPSAAIQALMGMVKGGPAGVGMGSTPAQMTAPPPAASAPAPEPPMAALGRLSGMVGDTPQGPKWRGPGDAGLSPDTPITSNILGDFAKTGPSHEERTYAQQSRLVTERELAQEKKAAADRLAKEQAAFGNLKALGVVTGAFDPSAANAESYTKLRDHLYRVEEAKAQGQVTRENQAAAVQPSVVEVDDPQNPGHTVKKVVDLKRAVGTTVGSGTPKGAGGGGGGVTNNPANIALARRMVEEAQKVMDEVEPTIMKQNLLASVGGAAADVASTPSDDKAGALSKVGSVIARSAGNAVADPSVLRYLNAAQKMAAAETMVSGRPSDFRTRLLKAATTAQIGVDNGDALRGMRAEFKRGLDEQMARLEARNNPNTPVNDVANDKDAWIAAGRPAVWPPVKP